MEYSYWHRHTMLAIFFKNFAFFCICGFRDVQTLINPVNWHNIGMSGDISPWSVVLHFSAFSLHLFRHFFLAFLNNIDISAFFASYQARNESANVLWQRNETVKWIIFRWSSFIPSFISFETVSIFFLSHFERNFLRLYFVRCHKKCLQCQTEIEDAIKYSNHSIGHHEMSSMWYIIRWFYLRWTNPNPIGICT